MFQEMQNEISKEALGEILFCFVTYTVTVFFFFLILILIPKYRFGAR